MVNEVNNTGYVKINTTNSVLQKDFKGDGEYIVVEREYLERCLAAIDWWDV